ncbi:hypothetical protein JJJ17_02790 [Paracoccus caeni]|uniref:Uncharacterized protein n=1 Tax=Paracoccus caeni TaxID=657651 RepID=A0A934VTL4_9RHOB|nr:hypothetical protein [Paracoccus caeni]MBK4214846.1 hypothetical protein [Paracoccus caeni]
MRVDLMIISVFLLMSCVPVTTPKGAGELIKFSKSSDLVEARLYSNDVFEESGFEDGTSGLRYFDRPEQLQKGAFDSALGYLRGHPFEAKEDFGVERPCRENDAQIIITYFGDEYESFVYTAPCWDEEIGPYLDHLIDLIGQYRAD